MTCIWYGRHGFVNSCLTTGRSLQALHPSEHAELHGKLRESQDRGTIEKALDTLDKVLQAEGIQVHSGFCVEE